MSVTLNSSFFNIELNSFFWFRNLYDLGFRNPTPEAQSMGIKNCWVCYKCSENLKFNQGNIITSHRNAIFWIEDNVEEKITSGKLVWAASAFLKKQFSDKNVNSTPYKRENLLTFRTLVLRRSKRGTVVWDWSARKGYRIRKLFFLYNTKSILLVSALRKVRKTWDNKSDFQLIEFPYDTGYLSNETILYLFKKTAKENGKSGGKSYLHTIILKGFSTNQSAVTLQNILKLITTTEVFGILYYCDLYIEPKWTQPPNPEAQTNRQLDLG